MKSFYPFTPACTSDMIHLFGAAGRLVSDRRLYYHFGECADMENKLYVGNLAYSTTEDDLRDHFSQAGTVTSATIIKDRESGRSKGFGFIEMSSQAEAEAAITMLNGQPLGGRPLNVNMARPREEQSRGGGGFNRGSGGRPGRGGPRTGSRPGSQDREPQR